MNGEVGILNVGAGDTKLSFDPKNPAERLRAARIVKDMIRRGYALLIEVKDAKTGEVTHVRATDFDEKVCEYIVADFDSAAAAEADETEHLNIEVKDEHQATAPRRQGGRKKAAKETTRRIPATGARAVAVARTAGG